MEKHYIGTKPFRAIDLQISSPTAIATGSPCGGERIFITDIAGSSEIVGAKIVVKDGTTVIWQIQIPTTGATPYGVVISFDTPLVGTINTCMYVEVDGKSTATPAAYACIVGFRTKN